MNALLLEWAYRRGYAHLALNEVNHREYVWNGTRYYCGWTSTGIPRWVVYRWERDHNQGEQS